MSAWNEIPEWTETVTRTLLQALKERDPYTFGHSCRVARYARLLAKSAGLSDYEQRVIEISGLFHDLGKMGIPDRVLLKPGRLTEEEEAIIRTHPIKSVEVVEPLSKVQFFKDALPGILHHHERIDGLGYPDGLAGDDIPLNARFVLVADTFDAMTTTRPYRKGLSIEIAYQELQLFSGRQFDAHIVKIFLEAHRSWAPMKPGQIEIPTSIPMPVKKSA